MPAGGNSRFRGYPARMSERQQLALLLQMTSQEIVSPGNKSESPQNSSKTSIGHRGSKNRWSNKNDASPAHRKEDSNEAANSSDEPSPDSPRSRSPENGTGALSIDSQGQSSVNQQTTSSPQNYQHQQQPVGSTSAGVTTDAEGSGAPCEMRRTPPQNKVDRSGSGQTGSSPRVTLRLNQVRGTRDEKKNPGGGSRQSVSGTNSNSMDSTSKTPSSTTVPSSPSTTTTTTTSHSVSANPPTGIVASSTADNSDVYEFKSSKEATPVRGTSASPNPNLEKEKDALKTSGGQATTIDVNTISSSENSTPATSSAPPGGIETPVTGSPSSKRPYEGENDEQDEENRRKKRKESESTKDNKTAISGRQTASRAGSTTAEKSDKVASSVTPSSFVEQCAKTGKPGSITTGKSPSIPNTTNADRKSPNSTVSASSPKPSSTGGSGPNSKTGTPAPTAESEGEEDRPKSSDSSSAPKVPPLKIVIPQSTVEQEQGNRNGKNVSTRGHQLPYVVASSNSNDSTDKDQGTTASGTTSPTEASSTAKVEDKKDFSGAIHSEERSTHHQRVLRSSHRSGNGGNGATASKEAASVQSGSANYANSSPLPAAAASADRSNNSSPQQRNNSPSPETTSSEPTKTTAAESTTTSSSTKTIGSVDKTDKNEANGKNQKDSNENSENSSSSTSTTNTSTGNTSAPVELHPRKRKMKPSKEAQQAAATAASNESNEATNTGAEVHPHDQPITNCYQLFLNIRQQIERRRKGLFPVQPKPPQGFKDYLMNRCTYVLAGNAKEPNVNTPVTLQTLMKDLYVEQEKERYRLRMQHVVEKEKLVLSVEQEILRVHGRAARALANQSLPFSVCTILKDEEVYNVITPEQEEKDRNARSRYNGRLFLSWLQDVDDKWEKIKEAMLLRHHNEAESLHAVQKMDWEWKLKEVGLCEFKAAPQIEDIHVPMVHVSDDFDLLPA